MALPAAFLQHLRSMGYHSRSDKHSKALADAIVADLMAYFSKISSLARAGQLVFSHNHDLTFAHSTWNTRSRDRHSSTWSLAWQFEAGCRNDPGHPVVDPDSD